MKGRFFFILSPIYAMLRIKSSVRTIRTLSPIEIEILYTNSLVKPSM
jgi:hypothetical protein